MRCQRTWPGWTSASRPTRSCRPSTSRRSRSSSTPPLACRSWPAAADRLPSSSCIARAPCCTFRATSTRWCSTSSACAGTRSCVPDSRGAPAGSRRATPGTVWPRASSPRRGPRAADRVTLPAPASTSRPYGRTERAEGAARAGERVSQAATQGGLDLLLLSSRGEQPGERAHLLGGALQHLGLALAVRPLGPYDLRPRLGDRALEAAPEARGDVARARFGEHRIHRVEAAGDAGEAGDRGMDVARRRIAHAVVGAEVAIVAGERRPGHAGAARAGLDAVA